MSTAPTRLAGNVLTPEGWRLGEIRLEQGRIAAIEGAPVDPSNNDAPRLIPGFVDLHVHGGGGADAMEGREAVATLARTHLRFGTTSLLATTMTARPEEVRAVLGEISGYMEAPDPAASRVLGVHLEGPFINPGKLGAQPAHAQVATGVDVDIPVAGGGVIDTQVAKVVHRDGALAGHRQGGAVAKGDAHILEIQRPAGPGKKRQLLDLTACRRAVAAKPGDGGGTRILADADIVLCQNLAKQRADIAGLIRITSDGGRQLACLEQLYQGMSRGGFGGLDNDEGVFQIA